MIKLASAAPSRDSAARPEIRRIGLGDLKAALSEGLADFLEKPSHTFFLVALYPIAGLALTYASSGADLIPLLFPLVAGFALVGPVAAIGVYELSRRREQGETPTWRAALGVLSGPALGGVAVVALALAALFVVWMTVAQAIYAATMGPTPPETVAAFARDVFGTAGGLSLIVIGNAVGALFAAAALAISVFSLPMLLDGERSVATAVATSVQAAARNPATMAVWGLIVGAILLVAALPAFIGLAVALPVLGHATWRLYRRAIRR